MESFLNVAEAIYCWLYGWQTLVGALVALLAALLTIKVMRRQMRADADRHSDSLRRKQMAARAQMPDALSELSAYARGCGAWLVGGAPELPEEPSSAVAELKEVIEFIEDSAAERTFQLVSWYQVFRARSMPDVPAPQSAQFRDRMYDTVLLQAYINSLFDYARNEADKVDTSMPSSEGMHNALTNAFTLDHVVRHSEMYDGVREVIERLHESRAQTA